jgi:hypothetical protein
LNDRWRQPLHLVEIDLHRIFLFLSKIWYQIPVPNFRPRAKVKSPLRELCASGLGFPKIASLVIRYPPPTRSSHGDDGDGDGSAESS